MSGRKPDSESPNPEAAADALSAEVILAWLKSRPDFLARHPELFEAALDEEGGEAQDNVVDLRAVLLRRSRNELQRLNQERDGLVALSRDNMTAQAQIHSALLAALEARTFEALIHTVTHEWPALLGVDSVSVGVESELALEGALPNPHLFLLPPGEVDRILRGRMVRLRAEPQGDEVLLFRSKAAKLRSSALARLDLGRQGPAGLLALGARQGDKFHPNQATDLLEFLAEALARLVQAWLGEA